MNDNRKASELLSLATDYALHSMIANLGILKEFPIGGSPERLDLFEQMIDTLLDNEYIVTAIRMKQNPQDY